MEAEIINNIKERIKSLNEESIKISENINQRQQEQQQLLAQLNGIRGAIMELNNLIKGPDKIKD